MKQKNVLVFLFSGFVLIFLLQYVHWYSQQSYAVAPKINIALNPASTSLAVGEIKTVIAIITPQDATNRISGFDITFASQGSITLIDIGSPSTFPGGDTSIFTQMLKTTNRVVYLIQLPDPQLPSAVQITIQIKGINQGPGSLQIVTTSSKIVGNFPENVFEFGTVDDGSYTVGNPLTPSPTSPNTLTPTATLFPTDSPTPKPTDTPSITPEKTPKVTEPKTTTTRSPNPSEEDDEDKRSPTRSENKDESKEDEKEVEGDVDDDKDVDSIDYLYYRRVLKGYKVPSHVKLDTDRDGRITNSDGEVIIRVIRSKREKN